MYTGQPMRAYESKWELDFARLAYTNALIEERMLMTLFVDSFLDRTKSSYSSVLCTELNRKNFPL